MHPTTKKTFALSSLAFAATVSCIPAHAEGPLSLKLSETVEYDSNYGKNSANQKEVTSTTAATLGFNKLYGRQSYSASGRFGVDKHKNFKENDNNNYDVNGQFVSEIASNWAVALSGSTSEHLNSIENNPVSQRITKNMATSHDGTLNVQYGVAGRWSLLGTLGASKTSYSLTSYNYQDRDQNSGGLRLVYNTSDLLSFGLGMSAANSEYPNQIINDTTEEVKQRSVDFSTNWKVTGISSLSSVLSYAKNKYKSDPNAEFKGFTGRLNYYYAAGGATSYSLGLSRSTNNDGSGTGLRNNLVVYDNIVDQILGTNGRFVDTSYRTVTTSLDAGMRWAATSKIGVNASLGWDKYDIKRSLTVIDQVANSSSRYVVFTLASDYQFSRAIALGCNVQQYKQTGESNTAVSYGNPRIAYDGHQFHCSASFTID